MFPIDNTTEFADFFDIFLLASAATEALLVLTCTFNSCYTSLWDIKMDWGLLQPCSKNFMLRDELVFKKRVSKQH